MNFAQAIICGAELAEADAEATGWRYRPISVLGVLALELLRVPVAAAEAYRVPDRAHEAQHRVPGQGSGWLKENGAPNRVLRMMKRAPALNYESKTFAAGLGLPVESINTTLQVLKTRGLIELVPELWPHAWRLTAEGRTMDEDTE